MPIRTMMGVNAGARQVKHDDSEPISVRLAERLRSAANADGGWGYSAAKHSRLEPTCWALLALIDTEPDGSREDIVDRAVALLARWQAPGGLLSELPGAPANIAFNGLAAITVSHTVTARRHVTAGRAPALSALLSAIREGEGIRSGRSWTNRQDNDLAAWPWNLGTSSWVEPTSWCTLALKKVAPGPAGEGASAARIADAERMLIDRCCLEGGWNYGNSNVLGKELHPYVPSSALALLAFQDRRALPAVARSVTWLAANCAREPTTLAMSLAMIALRLHGRSIVAIEHALRANLAAGGLPENVATQALALYALNGLQNGYTALAL